MTAVDNATNSSGPQSFNVVVDGTPPTISSSIIASSTDTTTGGYVRTNGSYFVYSNVSDATAGVASVTANVGNVTTGTTAAPLTTAGGPWTIGATTYSVPQLVPDGELDGHGRMKTFTRHGHRLGGELRHVRRGQRDGGQHRPGADGHERQRRGAGVPVLHEPERDDGGRCVRQRRG